MSSAIVVPQVWISDDEYWRHARGGVFKQWRGRRGWLTNTALLVREVEAVRRAVTAVADVDAATVRALELTWRAAPRYRRHTHIQWPDRGITNTYSIEENAAVCDNDARRAGGKAAWFVCTNSKYVGLHVLVHFRWTTHAWIQRSTWTSLLNFAKYLNSTVFNKTTHLRNKKKKYHIFYNAVISFMAN